jgi:hypothetical protein
MEVDAILAVGFRDLVAGGISWLSGSEAWIDGRLEAGSGEKQVVCGALDQRKMAVGSTSAIGGNGDGVGI